MEATTVGTKKGEEIYRQTRVAYTLGTPHEEDGKTLFPISVLEGKPLVRDEWLDGTDSTWWFQEQQDGRTVITARSLVTQFGEEEPAVDEKPLLFDTPASLVWSYYPSPSQAPLVRYGFIAESADHPIRTPAGVFGDCIRVTEYLLEWDEEDPRKRPEQPPGACIDQGWYTISWYARSVGLVAEAQFDRSGRLTYKMELSDIEWQYR